MFASRHPGIPQETTPTEAYRNALNGRALLLDVREEDEFAAGHAPGAVPLPSVRSPRAEDSRLRRPGGRYWRSAARATAPGRPPPCSRPAASTPSMWRAG
ncbi:hypothetical protein GCM10025734_83500 [Kitasatospora paranensis]